MYMMCDYSTACYVVVHAVSWSRCIPVSKCHHKNHKNHKKNYLITETSTGPQTELLRHLRVASFSKKLLSKECCQSHGLWWAYNLRPVGIGQYFSRFTVKPVRSSGPLVPRESTDSVLLPNY